jgi:hypothetical protein
MSKLAEVLELQNKIEESNKLRQQLSDLLAEMVEQDGFINEVLDGIEYRIEDSVETMKERGYAFTPKPAFVPRYQFKQRKAK